MGCNRRREDCRFEARSGTTGTHTTRRWSGFCDEWMNLSRREENYMYAQERSECWCMWYIHGA